MFWSSEWGWTWNFVRGRLSTRAGETHVKLEWVYEQPPNHDRSNLAPLKHLSCFTWTLPRQARPVKVICKTGVYEEKHHAELDYTANDLLK